LSYGFEIGLNRIFVSFSVSMISIEILAQFFKVQKTKKQDLAKIWKGDLVKSVVMQSLQTISQNCLSFCLIKQI